MSTKLPLLIGIVGGSGGGKSSVAQELVRRMSKKERKTLLLDMDAYYLPKNIITQKFQKRPVNYDHPDAFDIALLQEHLSLLKNNQPIEKPVYDFTISDRTGYIHQEPAEIVIAEGLLLFALPEIREFFDVKVFIDTDADIRILRRIQRDTKERGRTLESVIRQYLDFVRPMHLEFVEPSKRWADLIVPTGVENKTALDLLMHHMLGVLRAASK